MTRFLTDCHAHLCDPIFDADLPQVLERAKTAGIEQVVLVAETLADSRKNLLLARRHPGLLPGAGLYPGNADLDETDRVVKFIASHHQELTVVGEVGLDFWLAKDATSRELQIIVLKKFIAIARKYNLILNIHSRSAGRQTIAALLAAGADRVQMHGFDGKASTALPAVEAGFFFSIPPSIIRSRQKQKMVGHLPLSCLLVESDSPVLGPTLEERNEPVNIGIAVEAIATIKKLPIAAVREAICENTAHLYAKP